MISLLHDIWGLFAEPLSFAFMQKAFLIAIFVAISSALLSCFLVLKGWALMGDAISHAVLPGVVLAYVIGIPLAIGAFAAAIFCALATGYVQENSRVKQDTVMGVVFSGMFGLGLVLFTKIESDVHLDHILFGNILGLAPSDLIQTGGIALLVVAIIFVKRRDLLLFSFDPHHARAVGLSVRLLHYGLLALLSLTIVAALKAVGIILAIAMLIAPGATAFLLTDRFERMLIWAMAASLFAVLAGIYISFYIDSAPAPTIVLVLTIEFMAAFFFAPKQGLIARRRRQRTHLRPTPHMPPSVPKDE